MWEDQVASLLAETRTVQAELRAVLTQLAALKVEATTTAEAVREEKRVANEHRERVWNAVNALLNQQVGNENKLAAVQRSVDDMKPTVKALDNAHLMAMGAGKMAIWMSRAMYALMGMAGAGIVWLIGQASQRLPPHP